MQKPTLYQMLEYLGIILTQGMKSILRALKKKAVDENKLAETLKVRVNDIRKQMYELSKSGYVKYTKLKNESKQWWYIYLWRLDINKIKFDYLSRKRQELSNIKEKLAVLRRNVFRCAKCGVEFSIEQALEAGYVCPDCETPLSEIKRRAMAVKLEKDIKRLESEIKVAEK